MNNIRVGQAVSSGLEHSFPLAARSFLYCEWRKAKAKYLKTRVASELEERLDDADVALVDGDVQRRLAPFVARVQVGARVRQQLHHRRLVAEGRVVHGPVAVLVLP